MIGFPPPGEGVAQVQGPWQMTEIENPSTSARVQTQTQCGAANKNLLGTILVKIETEQIWTLPMFFL